MQLALGRSWHFLISWAEKRAAGFYLLLQMVLSVASGAERRLTQELQILQELLRQKGSTEAPCNRFLGFHSISSTLNS